MSAWLADAVLALLSAVVGAVVALRAVHRLAGRESRSGPPAGAVAGSASCRPGRDVWLCEVNRCEQAVCRAARTTDAVSSSTARRHLRGVVHRMEAELPNVRALAELGRGLAEDPVRSSSAERGAEVALRVRRRLEVGAGRFAGLTERLSSLVTELAEGAAAEDVLEQVSLLREWFPLLPSMSEVLGERPVGAGEPVAGSAG